MFVWCLLFGYGMLTSDHLNPPIIFMHITDISSEVFAQLSNRKENGDWLDRHEKVNAAMSSEWKTSMNRRLGAIMSEASSLRSKTQKLYALVDMTNELKAPHTACKKGCDACCHIQVEMPSVEAKRIAQATGRKAVEFRPGRHTTPVNQLGRKDTPCPFLVDSACSIYEVRPFVCRDMSVLDQDALTCSFENMALERANDARALPVPQTSAQPVFHAFSVLTVHTEAFADIRQFFP
jgi:Fe-S-cluster containining protein